MYVFLNVIYIYITFELEIWRFRKARGRNTSPVSSESGGCLWRAAGLALRSAKAVGHLLDQSDHSEKEKNDPFISQLGLEATKSAFEHDLMLVLELSVDTTALNPKTGHWKLSLKNLDQTSTPRLCLWALPAFLGHHPLNPKNWWMTRLKTRSVSACSS